MLTDLGSIYPTTNIFQSFPVGFSSSKNLFKLSYSNYDQALNDGYFYLRFFYPHQNLYDVNWLRLYPKSESEIILLKNNSPEEQTLFLEIIKYNYRFKNTQQNVLVNLQVFETVLSEVQDVISHLDVVEEIVEQNQNLLNELTSSINQLEEISNTNQELVLQNQVLQNQSLINFALGSPIEQQRVSSNNLTHSNSLINRAFS